jgi:chain length determinant protein EpsF
MNLYLFLSTMRARFGLFAMVLATTVLAAFTASLLLPKSYQATTSLVVDAKDEQSLRSALQPLLEPRERMSYMQTQLDIISSERVVRKVVRNLKLAESPQTLAAFEEQAGGKGSIKGWLVGNLLNSLKEVGLKVMETLKLAESPQTRADFEKQAEGKGAIEDWLVENLLKSLKVETSQSNVIHVSFSSTDPHHSAAVANAFAKAFVDTTLELRVEPTRQAAAWFDEQLKSLRANLENAQSRLTDYHRQKGIVSADERLDIENTRLGELSAQLVKVQDQTHDLNAREQQAREFLERGGSRDQLPDVLSNPLIQRLKTDLAQGEAKLQEMATQYGANYPQYQRQLSENRSLRERLDAEMRKITAGFANATRQSLRREAELRQALAAQSARLLGLKEDRNELTVLTRDMESAQRAYDTAHQRFVVSQVESRASHANINVLNPAAVPRKPAGPRLALNIALAGIVGTLLGIGIVILTELLDRRVRSREDLINEWNLPVLGVLNAQRPAGGVLFAPRVAAMRALPSPD